MRGPDARAFSWRLGLLGAGMAALATGLMAGVSGNQDPGYYEEHKEGSRSPALPPIALAEANTELTEHPLFEPSRQPWSPPAIHAITPTMQAATPPLPHCTIVGLVSSVSQRLALLRDDGGKVRIAHEGDFVAGWRITDIDSQGIVLAANKTAIHVNISQRKL